MSCLYSRSISLIIYVVMLGNLEVLNYLKGTFQFSLIFAAITKEATKNIFLHGEQKLESHFDRVNLISN